MPKALQASRYRSLPAMLREMRERAGLTQRELAQKLRLSHTLIHNSERAERRVDLAEFCDWCAACDVDPFDALRAFLKKR